MDRPLSSAAHCTAAIAAAFIHLGLLSTLVTGRCHWCHSPTTATFVSGSGDAARLLNDGACGYGAVADPLPPGFYAAAASAEIFGEEGEGCGECYQLRNKASPAWTDEGVTVMITDTTSEAGFVLTKKGFAALIAAANDNDKEFVTTTTSPLDVEFRRTRCEFGGKNLSVRVEETSRHPRHLVLKFLHQGGQTDIPAVEVAQVGSPALWQYMTRERGPVWSTARAPPGPLQLRMVVTAGFAGKWVWTDGEVLPQDWRPGRVYDAGVQIADVALASCQQACGGGADQQR